MPAERLFVWFLRLTALMLLGAAGAIFLPHDWMNAASEWLELGELPRAPLLQYLTRSVSLLYAALGASFWFLSNDVRRYQPFLRFLVPTTFVFDVTLIGIDLWIPMPHLWSIGEAVAILTWTGTLWWLMRMQPRET